MGQAVSWFIREIGMLDNKCRSSRLRLVQFREFWFSLELVSLKFTEDRVFIA